MSHNKQARDCAYRPAGVKWVPYEHCDPCERPKPRKHSYADWGKTRCCGSPPDAAIHICQATFGNFPGLSYCGLEFGHSGKHRTTVCANPDCGQPRFHGGVCS